MENFFALVVLVTILFGVFYMLFADLGDEEKENFTTGSGKRATLPTSVPVLCPMGYVLDKGFTTTCYKPVCGLGYVFDDSRNLCVKYRDKNQTKPVPYAKPGFCPPYYVLDSGKKSCELSKGR